MFVLVITYGSGKAVKPQLVLKGSQILALLSSLTYLPFNMPAVCVKKWSSEGMYLTASKSPFNML